MASNLVKYNGDEYSYSNRTYTNVRTGEEHEEGTDMFDKIDRAMFSNGINSLGAVGNIPMDSMW